jgi:hypothetical protein
MVTSLLQIFLAFELGIIVGHLFIFRFMKNSIAGKNYRFDKLIRTTTKEYK